jgi:hypothetical protein
MVPDDGPNVAAECLIGDRRVRMQRGGGPMARTSKDRIATVVVQVLLVLVSLSLARWSILRWEELRLIDAWEFGNSVFGWRGWVALLTMSLAAILFTLAVRLPLRPGFRWGRALWAVVPFALLWHLDLYVRWAEWGFHRRYRALTELLGLDRVTFLDDQHMRWVLATLLGAALGLALGRAPAHRTDSPRHPVSG